MAGIDLRPMTLGEVLDRTFTLYRERFLLFVGIMALPQLLKLIFNFGFLLLQRAGTPQGKAAVSGGMVAGVFVGAILAVAVSMLTFAIAQAATVWAVSELYLGREVTVRRAYAMAKGKLWVVLGVGILVFLAAMVASFFLILPGIYLWCRLALSVPVAVVEQEGPVVAMERSMELSRDNFWKLFLLLALVFIVSMTVAGLLQLPFTFFTFKALMAKQQVSLGMTIYGYISSFVAQVLVGPIGTISASLMYYNLRVQKEGFDIQHLFGMLGGTAAVAPGSQGI
jgi:hypothetical protein